MFLWVNLKIFPPITLRKIFQHLSDVLPLARKSLKSPMGNENWSLQLFH